jgi:hypothetical protein
MAAPAEKCAPVRHSLIAFEAGMNRFWTRGFETPEV